MEKDLAVLKLHKIFCFCTNFKRLSLCALYDFGNLYFKKSSPPRIYSLALSRSLSRISRSLSRSLSRSRCSLSLSFSCCSLSRSLSALAAAAAAAAAR